jgi:phosphoglycerate dehydrogenase-like enzyme
MQGNYSVSGLVGQEINNKVVGVLGTGAIGAEACRIFKVTQGGVFGIRVWGSRVAHNSNSRTTRCGSVWQVQRVCA